MAVSHSPRQQIQRVLTLNLLPSRTILASKQTQSCRIGTLPGDMQKEEAKVAIEAKTKAEPGLVEVCDFVIIVAVV